MDIRIVLSADEKALEFSRNLGKFFGAYVSQADVEAGICGKLAEGVTATLEPDTMPWEDEVEKGRMYAETAQKAAAAKPKSISDEDLRNSYAGNEEKRAKAKKWRAEKSLKSLTSMDQEQRKEFLAYMNA